jgi:toxin-antitoxin system PIN domain toxin
MRALLDVNVLLALFDQDHLHHRRAREWFTGEIRHGWASCAPTQNGLVRILSQPSYPNPLSPSEAAGRLRAATGERHHEFWECSISLLDTSRFDLRRVHGPRQVTDAYLLALAVENGGRLVTLDGRIASGAVLRAESRHLVSL